MRTALVDGDILIYLIGFQSETWVDWDGDGVGQVYADIREARDRMISKLEVYRKRVSAHTFVVCLSDGERNFRNQIWPEYKEHRKKSSRRPVLYNDLREFVCEEFSVACLAELEADDVMGIMATEMDDTVIISEDKDMRTIPGLLYNPRKDTLDEISEYDADRWHMMQTLMGDSCDGYKGCPGIGIKKAEKILGDYAEDWWEEVTFEYLKAFNRGKFMLVDGQSIGDYALVQARLARILRAEDYDRQTGEISLWIPPTTTSTKSSTKD